jgi:hypothetical protein
MVINLSNLRRGESRFAYHPKLCQNLGERIASRTRVIFCQRKRDLKRTAAKVAKQMATRVEPGRRHPFNFVS